MRNIQIKLILVATVLLTSKYDSEITTIKNKEAKIKDSTGKVTRYSLSVTANLKLINIEDKTEIKKIFTQNSNYDVAKNHSNTISNEKIATKNIIQQLSDDITNFITLTMRRR